MAEITLQMDGCTSLGSIDSEEDLKPRQELISVNPPQRDVRCDCCGRHINELKPFGKAGDPLVGDFDAALLVKKFRPFAPPDEEAERIYEEYLDRARSELPDEEAEQLMPPDYDAEEAERMRLKVDERVARLMPADYVRKEAELIRLDAEEIAEQMLAADYGTEEAEPMFPDYSTNEVARRIRARQEIAEQMLAGDYVRKEAEPISLAVEERAARPMFPDYSTNEVARRIRAVEERAEQMMALDLGTEDAERIIFVVCAASGVEASWECRDCIVLSKEEYFEKKGYIRSSATP